MQDILVVDEHGRVATADEVGSVDQLLLKVRHKPLWEGLEFIVTIFLKRHPEYREKLDRDLQDKFGSSKQGGGRHLLSMPPSLRDLIDYFYKDEIESKGPKFWREFARRFPVFAVPEKEGI